MNEAGPTAISAPAAPATPATPATRATPARPDVQSLSAAELLRVWEQGQGESPVEQALSMLAAACPDASREALAELSIGRRDACLLDLRERLFGTVFSSLADCPGCGERLEMSFRVLELRAPSAPESALSIERSDYELTFRLPNSLDLMALPAGASIPEMRGDLFKRCLLEVRHPEQAAGECRDAPRGMEIPAEIVDAAVARMSEADPQADVRLSLTCPCCEGRWQTTFDIVSYLWSELQERALQLLREVHLLASAYGWREAEILSLSPSRRQCYLEMLTG